MSTDAMSDLVRAARELEGASTLVEMSHQEMSVEPLTQYLMTIQAALALLDLGHLAPPSPTSVLAREWE